MIILKPAFTSTTNPHSPGILQYIMGVRLGVEKLDKLWFQNRFGLILRLKVCVYLRARYVCLSLFLSVA